MASSEASSHKVDGEAIAREITDYLNLGNAKHEYFHRGVLDLTVKPCCELLEQRNNIPLIEFAQPGRQTKWLAIRRLSPSNVDTTDQEHSPLAHLQYRLGDQWFPLQPYIDHCYGRCSTPLENAADIDLYAFFEAHIAQKRANDMDFWAKTKLLKFCLCIPNESTHWQFDIRSTFKISRRVDGFKIRRAPSQVHVLTNPEAALLEIKRHGSWQPFLHWIETLLVSLRIGYGTQQEWWASNGKVFPFMKLPTELRLCVYEQVYGQYLWPHPETSIHPDRVGNATVLRGTACTPVAQEVSWNFDDKLQIAFKDPLGHRPPGVSYLPAANRAVFRELVPHISNRTFKHIARIDLLFRSIPRCPRESLSRLSFGMTNDDYLKFIGYRCDRFTGFATAFVNMEAPIACLKKFEALKHLQFDFKVIQPRKVNGVWQSADPWAMVSSRKSLRISCQKIFVDWSFTMALAYIRQIPQITISGHVKDSTRIDWEFVLEQERKGIQHDLSQKIQAIQSLPWQHLPPICRCEHPCDSWKLNGPHNEGEIDPHFDKTRNLRDHNHVNFVCEG